MARRLRLEFAGALYHVAWRPARGYFRGRRRSIQLAGSAEQHLHALQLAGARVLPDEQPLPPIAQDGGWQFVARDAAVEWALHTAVQSPSWAGKWCQV